MFGSCLRPRIDRPPNRNRDAFRRDSVKADRVAQRNLDRKRQFRLRGVDREPVQCRIDGIERRVGLDEENRR